MNATSRVALIMLFVSMAFLIGIGTVFFFNGQSTSKYIKCIDGEDEKSMVIEIDEKAKDIVISGRKIGGTDIELFSDVEILAQWFSSNGHTKLWLDRITGELNLTDTPNSTDGTPVNQKFTCEATTPKL